MIEDTINGSDNQIVSETAEELIDASDGDIKYNIYIVKNNSNEFWCDHDYVADMIETSVIQFMMAVQNPAQSVKTFNNKLDATRTASTLNCLGFVSIVLCEEYDTAVITYDETDTEQLEEICMDIIESIASIDKNQSRKDAIIIAETIMNAAEHSGNNKAVAIYKRVVDEFQSATDEEYEMLKKSIFD